MVVYCHFSWDSHGDIFLTGVGLVVGVDVPLACLLLRLLVYGFMDKNIFVLLCSTSTAQDIILCERRTFILRLRDKLGCKIIALRFVRVLRGEDHDDVMTTKVIYIIAMMMLNVWLVCQVLLIQKQVVFYFCTV